MKTKKEFLLPYEAIVLSDFAENYQFFVQDKNHWGKKHCTLHTVVIYYLDDDPNLAHISFCFIFNDNHQDTYFVYKVQSLLIDYLKINYPYIIILFYFSDRCVGQYKNCKNFIDFSHHLVDFGVDAEWIFCAMSHGKSPCDSIGGFVKSHVAMRRLKRPLNNHILYYETMIDLYVEEIKDIYFVGIS